MSVTNTASKLPLKIFYGRTLNHDFTIAVSLPNNQLITFGGIASELQCAVYVTIIEGFLNSDTLSAEVETISGGGFFVEGDIVSQFFNEVTDNNSTLQTFKLLQDDSGQTPNNGVKIDAKNLFAFIGAVEKFTLDIALAGRGNAADCNY